MLISDWSSDVCSSNLDLHRVIEIVRVRAVGAEGSKLIGVAIDVPVVRCAQVDLVRDRAGRELAADARLPGFVVVVARVVRSRSEERRGWNESVSTCIYRGSAYH